MGDHNSVDVAQCCHEAILRGVGCLAPQNHMIYGQPMPGGEVLEGVYIDDHLLVAKVPSHRLREPDAADDTRLLELSWKAYAEAELPRAPKKSFVREPVFTAGGMEVNGIAGTCGVPVEKRIDLFMLICLLLTEGHCTKQSMQSTLGSFVHPFSVLRLGMSIFSESY